MADATRDPNVPAATVVRRPDGSFVRLELNGEEFLPWLSAEEPITFKFQEGDVAGLLTLTLLVSDFATTTEAG